MGRAILTIDLGFGDSGKGTMVDYLVRKYESSMVVRYGGGAQAAHNVVEPGGRAHTFAQFGSGTLAGSETYLGPSMIIEPMAMENEARHLDEIGIADPLNRVIVDDRCPIATPFDAFTNRLRELSRGEDRHGSCGMGIGETRQAIINDAPYLVAGDCRSKSLINATLTLIKERKQNEIELLFDNEPTRMGSSAAHQIYQEFMDERSIPYLVDRYYSWYRRVRHAERSPRLSEYRNPVIFEGSQGVLLDQSYGFNPYTTWSDVTLQPALNILAECQFVGQWETLGIVRAFMTRHGPGPLPTEDKELQFSELHNRTGQWQGPMRYGHFDAVMIRYALYALRNQVRNLAVTHLDWIKQRETFRSAWYYKVGPNRFDSLPFGLGVEKLSYAVPAYGVVQPETKDVISLIKNQTGTKVAFLSYGPTWKEKFDAY